MRLAIHLALILAASLAAGCKARRENSLVLAHPSALPFTTKPLYVLIGGRGSCGTLTHYTFGAGDYVTPFNGLRFGEAFAAHASGSTASAHPSTLITDFRNDLMTPEEHERYWRSPATSDNYVFACHSSQLDGTQQFVWWTEANARPEAEWSGLGVGDRAKRYGRMGFRRFVVERPPGDPYGGMPGLSDFVADVAASAKRLNPDDGLRPIYVIGHSMGGSMAMRLVAALADQPEVDALGLQTLDPISAKGCPSNFWSGITATQPEGCTRFPADADTAAVRRRLDAGRERAGGRIATLANWINYWQGPRLAGSESLVTDRNQNELPEPVDASDDHSYSKRLHSGPSPAGSADLDVRVVYRGVLIDGFKSHGWLASAGGIWRWKPRRVGKSGLGRLVDASRFGYVIRFQALALTRGDEAVKEWREPWDYPQDALPLQGVADDASVSPFADLPPEVVVDTTMTPSRGEAQLLRTAP